MFINLHLHSYLSIWILLNLSCVARHLGVAVMIKALRTVLVNRPTHTHTTKKGKVSVARKYIKDLMNYGILYVTLKDKIPYITVYVSPGMYNY